MEATATPNRRRDESQPAADVNARTPRDALPVAVLAECEISEGIFPITDARAGEPVVILVLLFTEPLGMISTVAPVDGMDSASVADAIAREFGPQLKERFTECGL